MPARSTSPVAGGEDLVVHFDQVVDPRPKRTGVAVEVRAEADQLSEIFAAAKAGGSEAVEIVPGREALGRRLVRLRQEAHEEVITLDRHRMC